MTLTPKKSERSAMKKSQNSERWHRWLPRVAATVGAVTMVAACGEGDDTPRRDTTSSASYRLMPAQGCEDVRDDVVDSLTEQVLQNRYSQHWWGDVDFDAGEPEPGAPEAGDDSAGGDRGESPSEFTETNVQEEGVDEPDIVKTDGDYIYTVADGSLQILKSWPPEDTDRVGRFDFPEQAYPHSLFLKGDRVAVFSYVWQHNDYYYDEVGSEDGVEPGEDREPSEPGEYVEPFYGTRLTILDVSDRTNPVIEKQVDIEGNYTNGRMIDDKVYVVSNGGMRNINIWQYMYNDEIPGLPERDYETTLEELEVMRDEARPLVKAFLTEQLADEDVQSWFPRQRILDHDGAVLLEEPLYECNEIYMTDNANQLGVLSISSFDLDTKTSIDSTGLLANGWQVYASQDNLYVAMSSRWWWWWGGNGRQNESHIHKFALHSDGQPEYRASGKVDGWLLNQFSFSEYEGHLRVATTDNRWDWDQETGEQTDAGGNHVIVVKEENGELVETGSVRNLAPTERIYSSRMMGDRGYIVTFRETDPLYTLDLSDPNDPKVLGELKITGFSSYLHPLSDDYLLAIGRDGDENGVMSGVHLQVFDVSDMTDPKLKHHHVISTGGWSSDSEAMWNHHAFTYQARLGVLSVPMNIWDGGEQFTGLMLFEIDAEEEAEDAGITEIGRVSHGDLVADSHCVRYDMEPGCQQEDYWGWYSQMRRSIIMSSENGEEFVYSLSDVGMKVNNVYNTDEELASVLLRERF
ncbi:hypothetical protein FRC91_15045 [Bradymonadales bacterium TMQ1]|uniref:Uncharacterized protein n=2 Tax=Lujinxingia sediminis TaxID=2480984 RepID=A0ABY0CUW0_9DELT|nr:hypothetical protein EA187_06910 [Lujinxingia sediminis]TXC74866.1 hypothetical protein FRC91_15045 [Bradymonadales bacterium TMQ1]